MQVAALAAAAPPVAQAIGRAMTCPRRLRLHELLRQGIWAREDHSRVVLHACRARDAIVSRMVSTSDTIGDLMKAAPGRELLELRKGYEESARVLERYPGEGELTRAQEEKFSEDLRAILEGDYRVMRSIHTAIHTAISTTPTDVAAVDACLDRFVKYRTAWRLLASNHLELRAQVGRSASRVGALHSCLDPTAVARQALYHAQELCIARLGRAPKCELEGDGSVLAYVPGHLSFMVGELVKNALHATVRTHSHGSSLPYVVVRVEKRACITEGIIRAVKENGRQIESVKAPVVG